MYYDNETVVWLDFHLLHVHKGWMCNVQYQEL